MKQVIITEAEARAIYEELKRAWITPENQQVIWQLMQKIEAELSN